MSGIEERIRNALPAAAIRETAQRYLEEPRGEWHGRAGLVVAPATTQEVAEVVRLASETGTPILPYGGGTGLVGGQVRPDDPAPVLLSLERMSKIRSVRPEEDVIVADAGATLAEIQGAAAEAGRLFPLTYASAGTAQIGGALSANSGGLNVLRYGNARAQCLGVEAVLPDGSILHGLSRLRKDNTGYSIRDLLIGAEGTLGIITGASLRLVPPPVSVGTALIAIEGGPSAALSLLGEARRVAGESVSAFELISWQGIAFLEETGLGPAWPLETRPDWAVLVEIGFAGPGDAEEALETLFVAGMEAGLATDGVVAKSEAQRAELWEIRETIPEANRKIGAVASHDVSLPLSELAAFHERATAAVREIGPFRINAFGHVGDGNLHWNVFPPEGEPLADHKGRKAEISRAVHDIAVDLDGSFSAEHGVGRLKVEDLERYGDPARLAAMRAIKRALDPMGIMNPGAVLRA